MHQKLIGKTINKIRLSCDCTDWLHAKITRRAECSKKLIFLKKLPRQQLTDLFLIIREKFMNCKREGHL